MSKKKNDVFHCTLCEKCDNDDMVCCDDCSQWFHFECVGVTSDIADMSWCCKKCDTQVEIRAETQENNATAQGTSIMPTIGPQATSSPASMVTQQEKLVTSWHPTCTASTSITSTKGPQATSSPGPKVKQQQVSALNQPSSGAIPKTSQRGFNTQVTAFNNIPTIPEASNVIARDKTPLCTRAMEYHLPYSTAANAFDQLWPSSFNDNVPEHSSMWASHPFAQASVDSLNVNNNDSRSANQVFNNNDMYKIIQQMQQKIISLEKKLADKNLEKTVTPMMVNMQKQNLTQNQISSRHAIPKELPPFHGDPEEWPLFFSNYTTSTTITGYSNAENLMRLQHCLKGKAREVVKYKLLVPDMVPEIITTLQLCFGQPQYIIESLINKIRKMPPLKDKLETFIEYAFAVQNIYATMVACELKEHLNNPMLIKELVEKMPDQHKLSWAMNSEGSDPVVKRFSDWIFKVAQSASKVLSPTNTTRKNSFLSTHMQVETNNSCCVCKQGVHKVAKCDTFAKLSLNEKWSIVKDNKLCRHCLNSHRNKCNYMRTCGIDQCEFKHHRLLHKYPINNKNTTAVSNVRQSEDLHTHTQSADTKHFFRIIPINIHVNNKIYESFAFLDEGASVSLIEENFFNKLGLTGIQEPLCLRWTNNTTRFEDSSLMTTLSISEVGSNRKFLINNVHTVKNLSLPTQSINVSEVISKYSHLAGITLKPYIKAKPLILIGSDNWSVAVPLKIKEGKWNEPIATKTRLGWALQGCGDNQVRTHSVNIHTCDCEASLQKMHEDIKNYFKLDKVEAKNIVSSEDTLALDILRKTSVKTNGQFEVGLLWRRKEITLPEGSYNMALNRARCLKRKLDKDERLREVVQQQIDNLLRKRYAKKLTDPNIQDSANGKIWYLPIFIALNPNKPNKVRLVWDGAAKANGVCLNDFLLNGPDLLNSLIQILIMFRIGKIAICGDISEMFHRINVKESDMHAQRFLHFEQNQNEPSVYVMRALTFGTTCAPCIANFIRNSNADEYALQFPRAVEAIHQNHYMDDYIDSYSSEAEAYEVAKNVRTIHSSAGFNMHNWSSNSRKVLEQCTTCKHRVRI